MTDIKTEPARGPRRRAIVKGAAWATPAVMVAAAAPTAAASAPIVPSFTPGTFCKHPGNPKYYHAVFCFKNTTVSPITVSLGNLVINGVGLQANVSVNNAFATSFVVSAGQTRCMYVDAGEFSDSANGSAVLNFSYPFGGGTQQGSVSGGTVADASLPPCGTGSDPSNQPGDNPPHPTSGP